MTRVDLKRFERDDMDWLVARHGTLYRDEAGFDASFEALVARVLADFLDRADPRECGFIAWAGDRRVGSILSTRLDDVTGQVRLFLIEPSHRGTGLAGRMLAAAEDFARTNGCSAMQLWTHESHRAACALYARSGWIKGDAHPARNFGQSLIELTWTKRL